MDYYFGNPNHSPQFSAENPSSSSDQFISDYNLVLDDNNNNGVGHQEYSWWSQSTESSEKATNSDATGFSAATDATSSENNNNIKCKNEIKRNKVEMMMSRRIAFRTRSELEVMDDGYKWRKYGKKSVKNSPNPRNYYKCSCGGCNVKKRVERDMDDSSYVITSYEGVHNHEIPSANYYSSLLHPNPWASHSSPNSPSS